MTVSIDRLLPFCWHVRPSIAMVMALDGFRSRGQQCLRFGSLHTFSFNSTSHRYLRKAGKPRAKNLILLNKNRAALVQSEENETPRKSSYTENLFGPSRGITIHGRAFWYCIRIRPTALFYCNTEFVSRIPGE